MPGFLNGPKEFWINVHVVSELATSSAKEVAGLCRASDSGHESENARPGQKASHIIENDAGDVLALVARKENCKKSPHAGSQQVDVGGLGLAKEAEAPAPSLASP